MVFNNYKYKVYCRVNTFRIVLFFLLLSSYGISIFVYAIRKHELNLIYNSKYEPVGSNTDSCAKIRARCRDTTTLYLAFIIRNLLLPISTIKLIGYFNCSL
jgi:CTP:phosphocholine cytidylyltransferase-like protein